MLNLPDLNRLRVFAAVFEAESLVAAAGRLHVTRSAVSQALKALEGEVGSKLFFRTSKSLVPTPPAVALYRSLAPLLGGLAATLKELESGRTAPAGLIRVGAPQDFGSTELTEAMVAFRKRYPAISFTLMLATPISLLEQLTDGKLDLAFVDNGDIHGRSFPVSTLTVKKEKFILACGREYFRKHFRSKQPKLKDLSALEFVDYLPHAPLAKIWLRHRFGQHVADLRVSFAAESVRAVIRATVGGFGLAVLPAEKISAELESGRLIEIAAGKPEMVNQITLARRLERTRNAREDLFVDYFLQRSKLS